MIIPNIILIVHNLINVKIDAYKIMSTKPKVVRHGINFGLYVLSIILLMIVWRMGIVERCLFAVNAFCNRQLFFDIPLNLLRKLPWDYVTPADPPGAVMDRIEIKIFGRNGKIPVYIYASVWIITSIILLVL